MSGHRQEREGLRRIGMPQVEGGGVMFMMASILTTFSVAGVWSMIEIFSR